MSCGLYQLERDWRFEIVQSSSYCSSIPCMNPSNPPIQRPIPHTTMSPPAHFNPGTSNPLESYILRDKIPTIQSTLNLTPIHTQKQPLFSKLLPPYFLRRVVATSSSPRSARFSLPRCFKQGEKTAAVSLVYRVRLRLLATV